MKGFTSALREFRRNGEVTLFVYDDREGCEGTVTITRHGENDVSFTLEDLNVFSSGKFLIMRPHESFLEAVECLEDYYGSDMVSHRRQYRYCVITCLPGYMPDTAPVLFRTLTECRHYMLDEIRYLISTCEHEKRPSGNARDGYRFETGELMYIQTV